MAPDGSRAAVAAHDGRVLLVERETGEVREVDRSEDGDVSGLVFSPDSSWLAWSHPGPRPLRQLRLANTTDLSVTEATPLRFQDYSPAFTLDGRHLAFLSNRSFDPVYDEHVFDLAFVVGDRPHLITLAATTPSPFGPQRHGRPFETPDKDETPDSEGTPATRIDLEGLADRIVPFPVEAARYSNLRAAKDGVLWLRHPVRGVLGSSRATPDDPDPHTELERYDLAQQRIEHLAVDVDHFAVSGDGKLVVLGTASQVPTRHRNHNGYLLRWDGEGILFDPGEGTQRQMLRAGVAAHDLNRICVTHFHGDHSLGLAGVIQRINLDKVPHEVTAHYPRSGQRFFDRLRYATAYRETVELVEAPVAADGVIASTGGYTLQARKLSHPVESYGYRLVEPDGRRMLTERLTAHGIKGPDVGRLQREGVLDGVSLDDVSETRRGQRFAFVMDTRLCDGVHALAEGCDLLVIESTFLDEDERLAVDHGHLTAGQAARVARDAGVRHLVLTHFSQRYAEPDEFERQARAAGYEGELTVAHDLLRVPVPKRR
ncbi:Ribonuclease BN [Streptomyces alboniger]